MLNKLFTKIKNVYSSVLFRSGIIISDQSKTISENEREARRILNGVFELNMNIGLVYYRAYIGADLDVYEFTSCGWIRMRPPTLTDDECSNIACNYPISFTEIRSIFSKHE